MKEMFKTEYEQMRQQTEQTSLCAYNAYSGGLNPDDYTVKLAVSQGSSFAVRNFEETEESYIFVSDVNCYRVCGNFYDKGYCGRHQYKERRVYNKKDFFPVEVAITYGDAKKEIVYTKSEEN
jgi:hypothetical protein